HVRNIPDHLRIFLFGLPRIDAVGTSVFLVSPFLVYLGAVRRWDWVNEQIGYRFSLDFLPFVFWLFMRSRIALTPGFRGLIFAATAISLGLTLWYLATGVDRRRNDVRSDMLLPETPAFYGNT